MAMPRNETPAARADPTPGKPPTRRAGRGERGTHRPAAGRSNASKVDEAALRDQDAQASR